jgi:hypothetical protein
MAASPLRQNGSLASLEGRPVVSDADIAHESETVNGGCGALN